jgi:hypothetical protein
MKLWYSTPFDLTSFSLRKLLYWHFLKLASSYHFLKLKIWIVQTESDEEVTKIKFVHLDELRNFDIHHFLIWHHLVFENLASNYHFLRFKILIIQIESNGEMTKLIVVDLDKFHNFCIENLFIWNHFLYLKL